MALVLVLVLTAFSGCDFSKKNVDDSLQQSTLDIPVQVFDVNPLTGVTKASDYPEGQRPVAIMINNLPAALPQTGILDAQVVYEMVTEGGITRLMAVFDDYAKVSKVGPVRSTRDQFVQFILPMNAICVHIGSSIYATEMLRKYQYVTVDGIYLGQTSFAFDQDRSNRGFSNEHCFYTDANLIAQGISQNAIDPKGGTIKLFDFVNPDQPAKVPAEGAANKIAFNFSSVSDAVFEYNADEKVYYKSEFGVPHIDEATGTALSFTNVFVLTTTVTLKQGGPCTDFDFTSGGEGWYFTNGGYEKVTWTKAGEDKPLKLFSADGKELKVNSGKSYISVVDTETLNQSLKLNDASPFAVEETPHPQE